MAFLKKNAFNLLILLLLICISIWGYKAYTNYKEKQNRVSYAVAQRISVFAPQQTDIVVTRSYIGRVEAINDTEIVPYISGYVIDIKATGGQQVKKGEVMITLKQEEYLSAVVSAAAELFSAKAEYINAKIKYRRLKQAGSEAVSRTDIDNAEAVLIRAKGTLEKAKAQYLTAETNLEYTYLTAPFDGVIGNIATSLGDYISPQSTPVVRLVQYNPIRVVFSVSDKQYLNEITNSKDDSFKVRLSDGQILPQTGELKYTANVVDKTTNSIAVYSEFENTEKRLIPDAYVNVLQEKHFHDIVLIPKELLQMRPNGDYVYTVTGDILQLHKVDLLTEYDNKAVVRNNFKPDEYIVAQAVDAKLLGQQVQINQISGE